MKSIPAILIILAVIIGLAVTMVNSSADKNGTKQNANTSSQLNETSRSTPISIRDLAAPKKAEIQ